MKKRYWALLVFSASLYAIPFLWSKQLWWLIFIFPIPLLYIVCTENLSFIHGYVWGLIVFSLHLSGGIFIIARLAGDSWPVGLLLGIGMLLYQALYPALLFYGATKIAKGGRPFIHLFVWTTTLAIFLFWVDQYCLWILGVAEGYPLMHPLVLFAQHSCLLLLLPMLGKQLLTLLFLLIPASVVAVLWYKNYKALLFFMSAIIPWAGCLYVGIPQAARPGWCHSIKSLPCMMHSTVAHPLVTIKVIGRKLKEIVADNAKISIVIMPESAFNSTNFENVPELLQLWSCDHIGKPLHIVFGACRVQDGHYYNTLHWVYDGVLQACFDKKHAMPITERLPSVMDNDYIRNIYFKDGVWITQSSNDRIGLLLGESIIFVPYICSELFFNHVSDDCYEGMPIIVIVNDTLLSNSYVQDLLVFLASFRAVEWQREIVYVSYGQSLLIDRRGLIFFCS